MTTAEFLKIWTKTVGAGTLGDPGGFDVNPGSASFYTGDQGFIGARQYGLQKGVTYDFQVKIDGNFTPSNYFALYSGGTKLFHFSSSGEHSVPLTLPFDDIEIRCYGPYSFGSGFWGHLYYFKAIAPKSCYSELQDTALGLVSVGFSDGKEDYNGELKGTSILTTSNLRKQNPYLKYMYVSSSL